jgi:hypothetical protein
MAICHKNRVEHTSSNGNSFYDAIELMQSGKKNIKRNLISQGSDYYAGDVG